MNFGKKVFAAVGALALAAVLATPASAGPINIGDWVGFCFNDGGPATVGCQNAADATSGNDFTFNAPANVILSVTDAFNAGDTFRVYDFGVLLFTTNAVPGGNPGISDPDLALASAAYSHGSMVLAAGNHQISVFNDVGCCGGGGAYLRVSVPEPGTIALIAASLLGLGVTRRRKSI